MLVVVLVVVEVVEVVVVVVEVVVVVMTSGWPRGYPASPVLRLPTMPG